MSRSTASWLATGLLVAWSLAGCSGDDSTTYTFEPDDSPVKVDTPELREAKERAGIEPCPKVGTDSGSEVGGSAEPDAMPLPDITLPCLGGGPAVNLSALRGTPSLINFWAQDCGPCRVESPILQSVYAEWGDQLAVIGIDWQDTKPDRAIAFADEFGVTYPQLADPEGATRAAFSIRGLPITAFADAEGSVVFVAEGGFESVEELEDLIDEHLGIEVSR